MVPSAVKARDKFVKRVIDRGNQQEIPGRGRASPKKQKTFLNWERGGRERGKNRDRERRRETHTEAERGRGREAERENEDQDRRKKQRKG